MKLEKPLYVVSTNYDFSDERVEVKASERDAILSLANIMHVGIKPLRGIDNDFWARISETYEGGWKGAAIFKIEEMDGGKVFSIDSPRYSAEAMDRAMINAPRLEDFEKRPVVVLCNQDFEEFAMAYESREAAAAGILSVLEVNAEDYDLEDDASDIIEEAEGMMKMLQMTVIEINPRDFSFEKLDKDTLPYDFEALENDGSSLEMKQ